MDSLDAFGGSFNEHLVKKAEFMRLPLSGTFELLPACNMRCKMCYIQQDYKKVIERGGLKNVDFWVDIFRQAADQGMLYPLITGGEPFLYPGFKELYERIQEFGFHIVINTNATLLNDETVKWLQSMHPSRLNISLYGASADTYERLCGFRDGFDRVIHAFELLKEYKIPFEVHTVLTPENIKDYQGVIDICNRFEVPLQMVSYMFPPFRKNDAIMEHPDRFSPEVAAEASFRFRKDSYRNDPLMYKRSLQMYCETFEDPRHYSLFGNNSAACRGGKCTFWVNWHGFVSGCGVYTENSLDLTHMDFASAWEKIVSNTAEIRLSEKCRTCKYRCVCPVCPAAAYCETGQVSGESDYLCRYAERMAELIKEDYRRLSVD